MPDRHSSEMPEAKTVGFTQVVIDEFRAYLHARRYAHRTTEQYLSAAKQFGCWLCPKASEQAVTEASVAAFVFDQRHKPCKLQYVRASLRQLLRMLRDRGELPLSPQPVQTAIDQAVQDFVSHLRDVGGLAESTCRQQADYTRRFLRATYRDGLLRLENLCPQDLQRFNLTETKGWVSASIQALASSLRTYLRFMQLRGICDQRLVAAVPRVPNNSSARLPRVMTEEQLRTFLTCFDSSTAIGKRDYAIAQVLATLGVRVGEVAKLQLEHLNWRNASLRIVRPKSRRENLLPMPASVGEAISDYLRNGRPTVSHRYVFAKHSGLADPLQQPAMRAVIIRAFSKCGFDSSWKGTHILRHTVATHLHQRGATLKELSDLLGHRSVETTKVYAKVNLRALSAVALPWPEVNQ